MMLEENISRLIREVNETVSQHHRPKDSVTIMAVSKGRSINEMKQAYLAGMRHFGENYWQEAHGKLEQLQPLCDATWHFIGPIQRNKCRGIAAHFDWVHGLCQIKTAMRLNDVRPSHMPALNVCIQVNIDNEPSKHGVMLDEIHELAMSIIAMPNLKLRGLMVIPKREVTAENQAKPFRILAEQLNRLNTTLQVPCDTLSMGMSQDWRVAIAQGSTMIRIGTAIFGERA